MIKKCCYIPKIGSILVLIYMAPESNSDGRISLYCIRGQTIIGIIRVKFFKRLYLCFKTLPLYLSIIYFHYFYYLTQLMNYKWFVKINCAIGNKILLIKYFICYTLCGKRWKNPLFKKNNLGVVDKFEGDKSALVLDALRSYEYNQSLFCIVIIVLVW